MIPAWVSGYIGIPFAALGRTGEGCDCYGLVRLVLSREYGKQLPLLSDRYIDPLDHAEIGALVDETLPLLTGRKLPAPEIGAVAVVRFSARPCHLGIYVGDDMILHSRDPRNGSVLERTDAPFFRGRIEGYYRVN